MKRQLILIFTIMITASLLWVLPTAAQAESRSYTRTETQINEAFRLQNTYFARFGSTFVDLQTGQAVITGTLIPANTGEEAPFSVTMVPSLVSSTTNPDNMNVVWDVAAVSINDEALTDQQVQTIADSVAYSYRRAVWEARVGGDLESVVVTETDITYTYSGVVIDAASDEAIENAEARQQARLEERAARQQAYDAPQAVRRGNP